MKKEEVKSSDHLKKQGFCSKQLWWRAEEEADSLTAMASKQPTPNRQMRAGPRVDMLSMDRTLIAWWLGRRWGSLRPGYHGGTWSCVFIHRRGWRGDRSQRATCQNHFSDAVNNGIFDGPLSQAEKSPTSRWKPVLKNKNVFITRVS